MLRTDLHPNAPNGDVNDPAKLKTNDRVKMATEVSERALAHEADTEFLVRKSMNTGYQVLSLLTPPAYTAFVIARRGRSAWSLNRTLRATWVGGLTGSAAFGGGAYLRYANTSYETTKEKRIASAYDTNRIRREDHSTIGAILMAVITPALFWNRASSINLILGGAGLGSTAGVITHYFRNLSGDVPPKVEPPPVGHDNEHNL
ncbi:hypothetical protein CC1G_05152 [Coprinopsis cinerea okayama7|uniref:Uncharacterized protein n=1 Tax=Coprinopsis cinerea (strain Okayama-7 / 130 / ATCC MYA-4618 / FGSC 9003) TaxID=240176 RepID=A8NG18_COPC7|nr:hypothetical protein CC1G_05152 [Coprinopsis cinerea okayama7\|eukprot:XP_001833452.2 hypothetical protein CC1G_05152 [Coprinopsis cinerea okayama7\